MLAERPLGFTPGTKGYEGSEPEQNSGRLLFEQHVLDSSLFTKDGAHYEAWVWLGGGGFDDDNAGDTEDEAGGWEISFFDNTDPATWRETKPIETHSIRKDYWGDRGSFVQIAGYGKIPAGTKAIRMRVWASTWSNSGPRDYDTEVALDNAHLGIIETPNMLINGDFELDDRVREFKGWRRPATWPFPRNGMEPADVNDAFGGKFEEGHYRPFFTGKWSYGYTTATNGWTTDAFTFSQRVDNPYPDRTPMMLMFGWIQGVGQGGDAELRIIGTKVEIVASYIDEDQHLLGADSFWVDWPVPKGLANVCRYDQNAGQPYCPRLLLNPPAGTRQIGLNVNLMAHTPYKDGWRNLNAAVDDFFLAPAEKPVER
jgi:hypothetical protein